MFGISEDDTVFVLLSLTLVAIAMSFVWGWLADRQGPKRTLVWVLVSWAVGLIIGGIAMGQGPAGFALFLIAGAILGSGLGGVQVADRVLMVRLSPPDKIGEFFGIYGLVGKGQPGRRPDRCTGSSSSCCSTRWVGGPTRWRSSACWSRCLSASGWSGRCAMTGPAPARSSFAETMGPVAPPERLSPAGVPLEPR